jgi:hypothetical protein
MMIEECKHRGCLRKTSESVGLEHICNQIMMVGLKAGLLLGRGRNPNPEIREKETIRAF